MWCFISMEKMYYSLVLFLLDQVTAIPVAGREGP
jgi:hypothetical protein